MNDLTARFRVKRPPVLIESMLRVLYRTEPLSPSPAVSASLEALHGAGLIRRDKTSESGWSPTNAGRDYVARLRAVPFSERADSSPEPSASERRVFKYRLAGEGISFIPMLAGARPLSVGVQNGALCLWAECDPAAPLVEWYVCVAGTGWPLPPNRGEFIGTCLTEDGRFVWHVYARVATA